jgi:hypothetical protein
MKELFQLNHVKLGSQTSKGNVIHCPWFFQRCKALTTPEMWPNNMEGLASGLFIVGRSIGIISFYRSDQSQFVIVNSIYDQK